MRDMTDEQIIETLATNRMHWRKTDSPLWSDVRYWHDRDNKRVAVISSDLHLGWNPLKYLLDAFQLVEEMKKGEWLLTLEDKGDKWKASFMDPEACFLAEADTPQRAICMAILDYVA